ncbi:MAG: PAS domain S-box protein [Firmicutes bacterium]|nr:PAS domain S-box protein [Bacillota bacterium]
MEKGAKSSYQRLLQENEEFRRRLAAYEGPATGVSKPDPGEPPAMGNDSLFEVPVRFAGPKGRGSRKNPNQNVYQDQIPYKYLRSIFDAVPAGISIATDTSCRVILHNPAAASFLRIEPWGGLSPSAAKTLEVKLFGQGRELEPAEMPIQRSAWGGETVRNQDIEFVWEDGVRKLARFSSLPLQSDNGEIIGAIATFEDITERKLADEVIKRSDQRIAEILESITDAFYAVDSDWRIIYVNKRTEKWWNRNKEELVGQSLWSIFPPTEKIPGQAELTRSMIERIPLSFETFSPVLLTWLEVSVYPTFDGGLAVYFRDISERKRVHDFLQEERKILKAIMENTETHLVYLDTDFNFVWVNSSYARGCRRPVEDFIGKNHFELYPDAENEAIFRRVRDTGEPIVFRAKPFTHPDRPLEGIMYWDWSLAPVTDFSGKVTGLVFSLTDVTEMINTEETLRETRDYLENLINYANAPIIVWDPDFRITRFNRAFEHLTEYSADAVLGQSLEILFPADRKQEVMDVIGRTASGEYWEVVEIPILHKGGDIRTVLWNSANILDESGNIVATIAQGQDITERKIVEEALRKSQRREELLSTVSSRLLESEDPQAIVNDLCQKTMEYLECDVFFNYLVDERQNRLHLNTYEGIPGEEAALIEWLDFGTAVCGCAALEARRIVAKNIPETPDPRTDLVRSYGVLAYACHPLMVGGEVLGTLSFGSRSRRFFTDEELAVMKAVADHLAIAVNRLLTNLKLHETSERYRELAEKLRDVDLRQSEEKFSRVFHLSPAMMAINRLDNSEYIDVNGAWLDARGYTREDIIGAQVSEFGEDPVFREEVLRELQERGRVHNLEVTYTTKAGEVRPALVSVETIHIEGVPCVLTASFDTTEQKRMERERIMREVNIATDKVHQSLESYKKIVSHTAGLGKMNFYSEKMKNIYRQAMMYHKNRAVPVLIQGETGAGKDVLAKVIHYGELRNATTMIDVNCAAISANLFESELFGYEAGAFTGSLSKGQIGKFDLAKGGTLFLDEIGDIPIELQAKLLRVIEEKEFFRIGGLKKIKTDVRIICATNVDLERKVEEGSFRKDLFYRLGVGYIKIPPLRERTEEILPLAHMFMEEFSRQKGKRFSRISGEASAMLLKHVWPGNIREMRNAFDWITYMFDDTELKPEHLELMFEKTSSGYHREKTIVPTEPIRGFTISGLVDHYITQVMKENNGDVNKAAKVLGITRPTLYYHLRRIKNNNAV